MDTRQIIKALKQSIPNMFLGVFPSNKIPKKIETFPAAFVANTDPSNKPGQHWVALYFPNAKEGEFFCSYGRPPHVKFIPNNCTVNIWNQKRIQGFLSSTCGQYCIYFLTKRSQGLSMEQIINQFNGNFGENDELIKCFVNDTFDMETTEFDIDLLVDQLCRAEIIV